MIVCWAWSTMWFTDVYSITGMALTLHQVQRCTFQQPSAAELAISEAPRYFFNVGRSRLRRGNRAAGGRRDIKSTVKELKGACHCMSKIAGVSLGKGFPAGLWSVDSSRTMKLKLKFAALKCSWLHFQKGAFDRGLRKLTFCINQFIWWLPRKWLIVSEVWDLDGAHMRPVTNFWTASKKMIYSTYPKMVQLSARSTHQC